MKKKYIAMLFLLGISTTTALTSDESKNLVNEYLRTDIEYLTEFKEVVALEKSAREGLPHVKRGLLAMQILTGISHLATVSLSGIGGGSINTASGSGVNGTVTIEDAGGSSFLAGLYWANFGLSVFSSITFFVHKQLSDAKTLHLENKHATANFFDNLFDKMLNSRKDLCLTDADKCTLKGTLIEVVTDKNKDL